MYPYTPKRFVWKGQVVDQELINDLDSQDEAENQQDDVKTFKPSKKVFDENFYYFNYFDRSRVKKR